MTTTIGSIRNGSKDGSWLTYAASSADAQRLIADLLGNFHDIEVDTSTAGNEPLVIVKCPNPQRAESLHDVIVTLDWGARPTVAPARLVRDALTA
jgi:hypothetical protein